MPLYALLTRLSEASLRTEDPAEVGAALAALGERVAEALRRHVPEARWLHSYAVLEPCDYLDVFEAPNEEVAARAAQVIRSLGHATTEVWTLVPWERFRALGRGH